MRCIQKGRYFAAVCLVGIAAVFSSLSQARDAPEVLRVAYAEFPPMEYRDANGEAAGRFIELTRLVVEEAGYRPEFIQLPVSRLYLYLSNGTVDVWPGISGIPMLDGEVLESWVSPYAVQLSAWYLEGTPPLAHFDQLANRTVIVIAGYTYGGLIYWLEAQRGMTVTEAPNHRSAINMLKRKRGDYLLDYREPVEAILTEPSDQHVRVSDIRRRDAAWLFSLANPRAALLRDEFDDAYLRLVEAGTVRPVRALDTGYVVPGLPEPYR